MIGTHKTTISDDGGKKTVRYHNTNVVTFDNNRVTLDTGGWTTYTTKKRMNQASQTFGIGFEVYQKDWEWFVEYKGETIEYQGDTLILDR